MGAFPSQDLSAYYDPTVPIEPTDIPQGYDYSGQGAIGADINYSPTITPVVPDTTGLPLPGQIAGLPGGNASNGAVGASDSAGVNMLYLDPTVNPTPTGGYMKGAMDLITAGLNAFSTYAKGSPQVGIPAARQPASRPAVGGALSLTTASGQTNWMLIGGVVLVGVIGMVVIAKWA